MTSSKYQPSARKQFTRQVSLAASSTTVCQTVVNAAPLKMTTETRSLNQNELILQLQSFVSPRAPALVMV